MFPRETINNHKLHTQNSNKKKASGCLIKTAKCEKVATTENPFLKKTQKPTTHYEVCGCVPLTLFWNENKPNNLHIILWR